MVWLAVCFILLEEVPAPHAAAVPALASAHLSRAQQSRPTAEQQALGVTAIRVADTQDVQEIECLMSPGKQPPHFQAGMRLAEANIDPSGSGQQAPLF